MASGVVGNAAYDALKKLFGRPEPSDDQERADASERLVGEAIDGAFTDETVPPPQTFSNAILLANAAARIQLADTGMFRDDPVEFHLELQLARLEPSNIWLVVLISRPYQCEVWVYPGTPRNAPCLVVITIVS